MDRRKFLKQVVAFSAGAAVVAPIFRVTAQSIAQAAAEAGPPVVVVAKGKDYQLLVKNAVAALGGMKQFVRPGNKVVVKPNIGWDRTPEQAANTHPAVVVAAVRLALEAGAGQVQVFDRSCNDPRRCYVSSGVAAAVEAIKDERVTCPFMDNRKFIPVRIEKGKDLTQWDLYKEALEADCYINLPIAKHHGLTRLTLGLKNVMGVMGGSRGQIHQQIAQKLADLCLVVRPRLVIIDATRILLRGGPSGGKLEDVQVLDTVIASTDPVAADAYATTLFGLKPEDIAPTVAAYKMGLGEMDLSKVKVVQV